MKRLVNISSILFLAIISVGISAELYADTLLKEITNTASKSETTVVASDWYSPFLVLDDEAQVSIRVVESYPNYTESSRDQVSINNPNLNVDVDWEVFYLKNSQTIHISLTISKLIFPFHSFL